jgi:hypothetical protein
LATFSPQRDLPIDNQMTFELLNSGEMLSM